jgi:hypothetical protein
VELTNVATQAKTLMHAIATGNETEWSDRRSKFDQAPDLQPDMVMGGLSTDQSKVITTLIESWFTTDTGCTEALLKNVLVPDCILFMFTQHHFCSREEADAQLRGETRLADIVSHFTASTTHDAIVHEAIIQRSYWLTPYDPAPPMPEVKVKGKRNTKKTQLAAGFDAVVRYPSASPASGSAFVSLSAAVTHMNAAEEALPLQGCGWEIDLRIGTAAFLSSEYCHDARIGHSPHVSARESIQSAAKWDSTAVKGIEGKQRADRLVQTCQRMLFTPHVETRIPYGKDGSQLVQQLLLGAINCRKGDANSDSLRTALVVTHGVRTYAVLVHNDGKVSFRDPHSRQQLNFGKVGHFMVWVKRQKEWNGSPAMPTTYFRHNPERPASLLLSIVIVPMIITGTNFDEETVEQLYDTSFLSKLLPAQRPATVNGDGTVSHDVGIAGLELGETVEFDDWLHRCLFFDLGPLTGGWTEGSVTRHWEGIVHVTCLPKCMTASSAVRQQLFSEQDFRDGLFKGNIVWATVHGPKATFVSSNAGRSPCPFCGKPMEWFHLASKRRVTRKSCEPTDVCHMVCCNFRAVSHSAIVFGEQSEECGSVLNTDSAHHAGQVFGCQSCPNDLGPVGKRSSDHSGPTSGVDRCHLLCSGCQERAASGLHAWRNTPMQDAQLHAWHVRAPEFSKGKGGGAVNAMLVTQWLSPASAKRCIDDAERLCRLNEELTALEVVARRDLIAEARAEKHESVLSASQMSEECNYLTLGDCSRGGTVFNYRPGDLAFGSEGWSRWEATEAMLRAKKPFPPNSSNLRLQYELFLDGNNGYTCSSHDIPTLSISRKYELCCFVHALTPPDATNPPIIAGSKILKSGMESDDILCSGGAIDANASRIVKVRCNSRGGFAVENPGIEPKETELPEGVTFESDSGHFFVKRRQFQTHQQLIHMDASKEQQDYTSKTGLQFWSSVGSLSPDTTLNICGFNCLLMPGCCAVQTGTNPHAGSHGYQPPRTHTYIDPALRRKDYSIHTSQRSDTVWLGGSFSEDDGAYEYADYQYDADPNDENDAIAELSR